LQTVFDAIMHLAEGLALAQCWASNTDWSLIIFVGACGLMVLRNVGQLVLLLKTLIRNRALGLCHP